jgi:hypothetical protein
MMMTNTSFIFFPNWADILVGDHGGNRSHSHAVNFRENRQMRTGQAPSIRSNYGIFGGSAQGKDSSQDSPGKDEAGAARLPANFAAYDQA